MFEKDAEELVKNLDDCHTKEMIRDAFKDGAEFGYNKANEWHYVKDGDLPNTELGIVDVTVAYINAFENPCKMDCCFNGTNFVYWDNECTMWVKVGELKGNVYAWKYLEKLPELKESE